MNLIRPDDGTTFDANDYFALAIPIALGALCLVLSYLISRPRRATRKRIEQHFRDNPAEQEYRMPNDPAS